ncbi:hypothetical protein M3Y97_00663200 [Aphelenchoides bicaudatus]|nr:hypothetical protein M3Y97_00663200 [Aphelenchoides bicaudatus]
MNLFQFVFVLTINTLLVRSDHAGKSMSLSVGDDHMVELYQRWIDTGISSLFAAMAQQQLKQVPSAFVKKHFFSCSREAETLKLHAKCLSKLMKSKFGPTVDEARRHPNRPPRLNRYIRPTVLRHSSHQNKWIGAFRTATAMERRRRKRAVREVQQI